MLGSTGPRRERACAVGRVRWGCLHQDRWRVTQLGLGLGGARMHQLAGLAAGVCRHPCKMPWWPRGEEAATALRRANGGHEWAWPACSAAPSRSGRMLRSWEARCQGLHPAGGGGSSSVPTGCVCGRAPACGCVFCSRIRCQHLPFTSSIMCTEDISPNINFLSSVMIYGCF